MILSGQMVVNFYQIYVYAGFYVHHTIDGLLVQCHAMECMDVAFSLGGAHSSLGENALT